ncbi:MAG: hypothetical protein EPO07_20480 [Verrucomicrobia bacterium]|nr:MAG: hypothetical protein EPO07_20480 [Verrucomicrobiota bacterium]
MKKVFLGLAALVLLASLCRTNAETTNPAPDFQEVFNLVRDQLKGADTAEMNRAAVQGLLQKFNGRVALAGDTTGAAAVALVARTNVFDDGVAYVRVNRVEDGLAEKISSALASLGATNKVKGAVLDLRFASGENYPAVVATAELFISKETDLLDWGKGVVKTKANADAFNFPLVVLVNRETRGAAEALAAALREAGVALILGSGTAGNAFSYREFPLKSGQRLLVASGSVKLGDGNELPATGLKPDIQVDAKVEDERNYLDDPYGAKGQGAASGSLTNRPPRRPRITEADLVRERREGTNIADFTPARDREPEKPQLRDPALARAVDLLKALAVVRKGRS